LTSSLANVCGERRDQRRAGNDMPLLGERATARGRVATEGGYEHGGVKSGHPFERQLANALGERRDRALTVVDDYN
jgi:hypothetical protein